jgi:hypothetical protein
MFFHFIFKIASTVWRGDSEETRMQKKKTASTTHFDLAEGPPQSFCLSDLLAHAVSIDAPSGSSLAAERILLEAYQYYSGFDTGPNQRQFRI